MAAPARRQVLLEAFIGIVFATAQAGVFLVLEKSPAGPEHLRETLVGTLFTVAPDKVLKTAILYAAIGAIHFLLRRPFFEITNDPRGAEQRGRRLFAWDFLFYGLFGFVVTSSVQIAGVLLVFGLLVIPAVAGLMATTRPAGRSRLDGSSVSWRVSSDSSRRSDSTRPRRPRSWSRSRRSCSSSASSSASGLGRDARGVRSCDGRRSGPVEGMNFLVVAIPGSRRTRGVLGGPAPHRSPGNTGDEDHLRLVITPVHRRAPPPAKGTGLV
jgi:hypothetical protein